MGRVTATADPLESHISPEEMVLRIVEMPDWSWDESQAGGDFEEEDEEI